MAAHKKSKRARAEEMVADVDGSGGSSDQEDEVEALVAEVGYRAKVVEHNRTRIAYYQSQLEESEKNLQASESRLITLMCRKRDKPSTKLNGVTMMEVKVEGQSVSPVRSEKFSSEKRPKQKPKLVISSPVETRGDAHRSKEKPKLVTLSHMETRAETDKFVTSQVERPVKISSQVNRAESQTREQIVQNGRKEHVALTPSIRSTALSPRFFNCNASTYLSSRYKRKLRCLIFSPVHENLFMTSGLEGLVNLWHLHDGGSSASLMSCTDCLSPKQRRWPEDLAWNPQGHNVVAAYTADGGENQIGVIDLVKPKSNCVTFLEDKPHTKGIINSVKFMPWDDGCFVTGGSDHSVVLWKENKNDGEGVWRPRVVHKTLHSSAVMAVAGLHHKKLVMSAGCDKRIVGFDLEVERADYTHKLDCKCMSVLPNPCDVNLFLARTVTTEQQLRLYDIRLREELHSFGWVQESSQSESALISQSWSSDGLYITSGSADPKIHLFDIRYNSHKPFQSLEAHKKRVLKAVWHQSLPLLISISSDLTIGLHSI